MHDSVTCYLLELRAHDEQAATMLWQSYFDRVVRLAQRLLPKEIRSEGPEDITQEVCISMIRGAQEGRFSRLQGRDDLWQVLVMLTYRNVSNKLNRERAQKRGGGRCRGESIFFRPGIGGSQIGMTDVLESKPTPADLDELILHCEHLLSRLADEQLVVVALKRLEGHTNVEIAEQFSRSTRWVERKLELIRKIWSSSLIE